MHACCPGTVTLSGQNGTGMVLEQRFDRLRGDFACDARGLTFTSRGLFFVDENRTDAGDAVLATAGGLPEATSR